MLVDSHCHLNSEIYDKDLDKILLQAKEKNIEKLLSIGIDYSSSKKNILIKNKFKKNVLISIGLHPNYIDKNYLDEINKVLSLFDSQEIDAIGEIGLDFFKNSKHKSEQIQAFEKQIDYSIKKQKPAIIHTRDAFEETYNVIKNYLNPNTIIHCFTGDKRQAKKFLELNCYISFSGIITFKNAKDICEAANYVPLENILIETDSPYLSPHPYRGKINYPENLIFVLNKLSEIKKIDVNKIANITTDNFNKIFKIND